MSFSVSMIDIVRDGDQVLMLMHIALEKQFLSYAIRCKWEFVKFSGQTPRDYVAYELFGKRTCDELELRATTKNPWFAFDTSADYP